MQVLDDSGRGTGHFVGCTSNLEDEEILWAQTTGRVCMPLPQDTLQSDQFPMSHPGGHILVLHWMVCMAGRASGTQLSLVTMRFLSRSTHTTLVCCTPLPHVREHSVNPTILHSYLEASGIFCAESRGGRLSISLPFSNGIPELMTLFCTSLVE